MYLCVVLRVQQQHLRAAGLRCARSACFSFSFSIILESCTVVADTTNCLVVFNTFIRSNHKVPPLTFPRGVIWFTKMTGFCYLRYWLYVETKKTCLWEKGTFVIIVCLCLLRMYTRTTRAYEHYYVNTFCRICVTSFFSFDDTKRPRLFRTCCRRSVSLLYRYVVDCRRSISCTLSNTHGVYVHVWELEGGRAPVYSSV